MTFTPHCLFIEADNLDAAIELASRISGGPRGGIEVRPIMES